MSAKNISFILHKPQLSENIGACARGMKNFNFEKLIVISPKPIFAHRWKFARPTDSSKATQKGVFEIEPNLWIAGDYLAGGRVEGAYLSGLEASQRLM